MDPTAVSVALESISFHLTSLSLQPVSSLEQEHTCSPTTSAAPAAPLSKGCPGSWEGTATGGVNRQGGHPDSTREDPPQPFPSVRSLLALSLGQRHLPWSLGHPLCPSFAVYQPDCKGKIYACCNIPMANTICCFPLSETNLSTIGIIMIYGIVSDN